MTRTGGSCARKTFPSTYPARLLPTTVGANAINSPTPSVSQRAAFEPEISRRLCHRFRQTAKFSKSAVTSVAPGFSSSARFVPLNRVVATKSPKYFPNIILRRTCQGSFPTAGVDPADRGITGQVYPGGLRLTGLPVELLKSSAR